MNDFWNGVTFACACLFALWLLISVVNTHGKREVRDQCTEYGRVEFGGGKYKCTFEVAK